jgi:hypothetical protein
MIRKETGCQLAASVPMAVPYRQVELSLPVQVNSEGQVPGENSVHG